MGHQINKLTVAKVNAITKPGQYADGLGLYLQVAAGGSKTWMFRYMRNGKARKMSLGSIHVVPLKDARQKAIELQRGLLEGIDPVAERAAKRAEVERQEREAAKVMTFKECAEAYIASHRAGWKNVKHAQQWANTLEAYAYPYFGDSPVQDVDTALVMKALTPIWTEKPETASRVRSRIENILSWATSAGYRTGENPARWNGHLKHMLPKRDKVAKVKHFPALPYSEVAAFMSELNGMEGVAARALEFTVLTGVRSGQVRKATWDEIDMDNALWIAPDENTKSGDVHRVPLSARALEILKSLPREAGNPHIFIGGRKPMLSENGLLAVIKRMPTNWTDAKGDRITPHGFRSTFKDWVTEQTSYAPEVAEMALGHAVNNKVEAAYRRGDLLERRYRLMEDWAAFCAKPSGQGGNVVSLREAV